MTSIWENALVNHKYQNLIINQYYKIKLDYAEPDSCKHSLIANAPCINLFRLRFKTIPIPIHIPILSFLSLSVMINYISSSKEQGNIMTFREEYIR